jgi:hypothetical protein
MTAASALERELIDAVGAQYVEVLDARSEEMGSGDPDGSAGGARGKAPRGIAHVETA